MNHFDTKARRNRVAFVGTYPPKECGIATFTLDVANAADIAGWKSIVVAVDDAVATEPHSDSKVVYTIDKDNRGAYTCASLMLSDFNVSVLCIQHEYGIYGGEDGEYVLDLIRRAPCPVVVTLHTILPNPSDGQKRIIKEIERYASMLVTMARTGVEILVESYGVARHKIAYIPHGAPIFPSTGGEALKEQFGLSGKTVLSTFGLISPNKGIEDAIAAIPALIARHPNLVYQVLGATHPVVKRREGEWYREQLVRQVSDLGIEENVRFIDQYLTLPELIDHLIMTDIYITPYYANPHQITSGTLSYALAAGTVIVSTPYIHARELLAGGRGFLYPFRDSEALANRIMRLLDEPNLLQSTRRRARDHSRQMTWESVGQQYVCVFNKVLRMRGHKAVTLPRLESLAAAIESWEKYKIAGYKLGEAGGRLLRSRERLTL